MTLQSDLLTQDVATTSSSAPATTTVTLIKGDGIGPEIGEAVQQIFHAAGVPVTWEEAEAGLGAIEKTGVGLPPETLAALQRNPVALKGPTATPIGGGHKSINVTIRGALDLYANVRPVRTLPGVATRYENVDLVIVRENVEDTYSGIEYRQTPDVAQCLKVISRPGSEAVIRYAFELARTWGRKKVTCLTKANIHKLTDGLFLEVFREIAQAYPGIQAEEMLVDNACMQLVIRPEQFDVMVMPNLYGDIVSDVCAGLVGGLGVAPGANIGNTRAVFEAVHGTAPDIAGKGLANPMALLLSSTFMLRHMGLHQDAARIEAALDKTLADGIKTGDLGGTADLATFTGAIIANLAKVEAKVPAAAAPGTPAPALPARAAHAAGHWELHGVDVFVRHAGGLPELPTEIGPLKLTMMSNRGTKVYPGPCPDILLVDWHRARYVAAAPVTEPEIQAVITGVGQAYEWMHIEKLYHRDGVPMYTKAQGE